MKGTADLMVQGHGAGRIYIIHNHVQSASNPSFISVLITNWITTVLVLGEICIVPHVTDMHKGGRFGRCLCRPWLVHRGGLASRLLVFIQAKALLQVVLHGAVHMFEHSHQ